MAGLKPATPAPSPSRLTRRWYHLHGASGGQTAAYVNRRADEPEDGGGGSMGAGILLATRPWGCCRCLRRLRTGYVIQKEKRVLCNAEFGLSAVRRVGRSVCFLVSPVPGGGRVLLETGPQRVLFLQRGPPPPIEEGTCRRS